MPEKNTGFVYTIVAAVCLCIGFAVAWVAKPIPEPVIEMTVHGLFVNGKHVDLDSLKFKLPVVPDKGKDGKRKPGDLPAGQLGPAANLQRNITHIVRDCPSTVDGAGLCVPACLETIALASGHNELKGFVDHAKRLPGGHWPEKTRKQFDCFVAHKQGFGGVPFQLVMKDARERGFRLDDINQVIENNGPVMIAYVGRVDDKHYGNQMVCTALILNGYHKGAGLYSVVDTNYPDDKNYTMTFDKVKAGCDWYAYFTSLNPPSAPAAKMDGAGLALTEDLFVMWYGDDKPPAKCPCSPCDCGSCACHLAKPAVMQVEQRGGSPKSPELFGIESLVSILKDFKEAIFGSNGKPGLRDDIAGGLRDFYGTLRTGVIVAGGCVAGWMLWVGVSLQKIATAKAL